MVKNEQQAHGLAQLSTLNYQLYRREGLSCPATAGARSTLRLRPHDFALTRVVVKSRRGGFSSLNFV